MNEELRRLYAGYRSAIRWLRDARNYKNMFVGKVTSTGEVWEDGVEGELASDAMVAYDEAASAVLRWRSKIEEYKKNRKR